MSQENVAKVRQALAAFGEQGLDAALGVLHPEIEWDVSRRQLEPAVFHGHEGVREFVSQLGDVWADQRFEEIECIDAGDAVAVTIRFVSTGREGIEVPATAWYAFEFRGGLVVRATMCQSRSEALDAVGGSAGRGPGRAGARPRLSGR